MLIDYSTICGNVLFQTLFSQISTKAQGINVEILIVLFNFEALIKVKSFQFGNLVREASEEQLIEFLKHSDILIIPTAHIIYPEYSNELRTRF